MRIDRDVSETLLIAIFFLLAINTLLVAGQLWQSWNSARALERQTELMEQAAKQPDEPSDEETETEQPARSNIQPSSVTAIKARVTAYTARIQETDADPGRTAIMEKPVPGWTCAVSRDLAHWLGGRIWIEGVGVRKVNDLMNERFKRRVDILVGKAKEAASVTADERRVIFLGKG